MAFNLPGFILSPGAAAIFAALFLPFSGGKCEAFVRWSHLFKSP
jgi:hypothetical protein